VLVSKAIVNHFATMQPTGVIESGRIKANTKVSKTLSAESVLNLEGLTE
jgi:hypothetical protein